MPFKKKWPTEEIRMAKIREQHRKWNRRDRGKSEEEALEMERAYLRGRAKYNKGKPPAKPKGAQRLSIVVINGFKRGIFTEEDVREEARHLKLKNVDQLIANLKECG